MLPIYQSTSPQKNRTYIYILRINVLYNLDTNPYISSYVNRISRCFYLGYLALAGLGSCTFLVSACGSSCLLLLILQYLLKFIDPYKSEECHCSEKHRQAGSKWKHNRPLCKQLAILPGPICHAHNWGKLKVACHLQLANDFIFSVCEDQQFPKWKLLD